MVCVDFADRAISVLHRADCSDPRYDDMSLRILPLFFIGEIQL